ncbi:MAG: Arc family DNA-binding protein [Vicinamibacterales bacterium]|jgi:plasmid stability protein|nr:Arc family DNA-binding protein [Vicinamibacterales bacterium]MDP7479883.1 Arc family DNA-binding protein [Vicinamibacterales bacterium]HJN43063.1 Arc family DNA-binding protein [Vicinamibacterales bacterium]|tara:strand:+ start:281 stop:511 length:231 start_codon:yes stop_codon:yes gene_type:complete
MPGIHVRDLPKETVAALKRRAEAHHRSVQGEIRAILAEAARASPPDEGYAPILLTHVEVGNERTWSREDIYGDDGR